MRVACIRCRHELFTVSVLVGVCHVPTCLRTYFLVSKGQCLPAPRCHRRRSDTATTACSALMMLPWRVMQQTPERAVTQCRSAQPDSHGSLHEQALHVLRTQMARIDPAEQRCTRRIKTHECRIQARVA